MGWEALNDDSADSENATTTSTSEGLNQPLSDKKAKSPKKPNPSTQEERPETKGPPITLAFAGDSHFEAGIASTLTSNPEALFADVAPILTEADLAVLNLETSITNRGTPSAKTFNFRAPAEALSPIKAAGVDVVSMANNHGLDYGAETIGDAQNASQQFGLPIIGIGQNEAEAFKAFRTKVKGRKISVVAATQVLDSNLIASWTARKNQPGLASAKRVKRLVKQVRRESTKTDLQVVFLHWGIEKQTCPSPDQQQLAKTLVKAGADIVVGGHAHRMQGAGWMNGAVVAYGLGNFLFNSPSAEGERSGILLITVEDSKPKTFQWEPVRISNGVPFLLAEPERTAERNALEGLTGCTDLDFTKAG